MTATNRWRPHFFGIICLTFSVAGLAQRQTDWPLYGHDSGSTRFSSLSDINTGNASELKRAWTYSMVPPQALRALPVTGIASRPLQRRSETRPLMVDGVLDLPTPYSQVIALDAISGKQISPRITPRVMHLANAQASARTTSKYLCEYGI
ncbi:MAG: hypothetical protein ABI197_04810 [Granulicella sp.]